MGRSEEKDFRTGIIVKPRTASLTGFWFLVKNPEGGYTYVIYTPRPRTPPWGMVGERVWVGEHWGGWRDWGSLGEH